MTAQLLDDLRARKPTALARAISLVENEAVGFDELLSALHEGLGRAHRIGLTGPPGAGKSTLVERLTQAYRARGLTVGIVAVDPSSPFTGGALLGDRIRMERAFLDPGVFIRSMATRGHLGGMALAAPEAVRILDASGKDLVIVETVGVGQAEVDVAAATDTTLVVVTPGWGDAVQVAKAGILEIADVFVVNKADREGASAAVRDLEQMIRMGSPLDWTPSVIRASAQSSEGTGELWEAIAAHRAHLEESGALEANRRERLLREVESLASERVRGRIHELLRIDQGLAEQLAGRKIDPYRAAAILEERVSGSPGGG